MEIGAILIFFVDSYETKRNGNVAIYGRYA